MSNDTLLELRQLVFLVLLNKVLRMDIYCELVFNLSAKLFLQGDWHQCCGLLGRERVELSSPLVLLLVLSSSCFNA